MEKDLNNIWLLEKGEWNPDQVKVHQVTDRSNIQLYGGDREAIDHEWLNFLMKKPWTFKGPTIRLIGWHTLYDYDGKDSKRNGKLILEVIPSDYKEACLLGYLGVAMVPVTEDDFIVLQDRSKRQHTYSDVGVPGCTPTDTDVLPKVIHEIYEEFAVDQIDKLSVLGLIQIGRCVGPIPNHCLVVKVTYPKNFADLQQAWEHNVKDDKKRNEGKPVKVKLNMNDKKIVNHGEELKLEYPTCLALLMVLDSKLTENEKFLDYKWFDQINEKLLNIKPKL